MKKELVFIIILLVILYLKDFIILGNIILKSLILTELFNDIFKIEK